MDRKTLGFLKSCPEHGEPIDYALAWGVSLNHAQRVLRQLFNAGYFTRSKKQGRTGSRIYKLTQKGQAWASWEKKEEA